MSDDTPVKTQHAYIKEICLWVRFFGILALVGAAVGTCAALKAGSVLANF